MFERLRHVLLGRWAALVCKHPIWSLTIALLLAAGAIFLTVTQLSFEADRNLLIRQDLPWNERYVEFRRQFRGNDSIVAVVEVPKEAAGRANARAFIHEMARRLQQQPESITAVSYGFPQSQVSGKLVRLLPLERFEPAIEQMTMAGPVLTSSGVGELLGNVVREMSSSSSQSSPAMTPEAGGAMIRTLGSIMEIIEAAVRGQMVPGMFDRISIDDSGGWQYLTSEDGQLYLMDIEPRRNEQLIDPFLPAVQTSREVLAQVQAMYPQVQAGLTGMPVIQADETAMSMRDSTLTSVIAAVAIVALLVWSFRSWLTPLIMVLSLLVGIAWSFGYVTLAVGHLQVLSVVFTVILLGLGIDFTIHIVSRLELIRHKHEHGTTGLKRAMIDTFETIGPGTLTGAVTTAAAFGSTMLTDFKGMAEMGHIAAVGLILCLIAIALVLPATMQLLRSSLTHIKPTHERTIDLSRWGWLAPLLRHPILTTSIAAVIVAVCAVAMSQVRYDNNLKNLLPQEMDSLQWLAQMEEHGVPLWAAASVVDDLEQAQQRVKALRDLPSVADVGGIGLMFPRHEDRKLQIIEAARTKMGDTLSPDAASGPGDSPASLAQRMGGLQLALTLALNRADVRQEPAIHRALGQLLTQVRQVTQAMNDPAYAAQAPQRIAELNAQFDRWRNGVARQIRQAMSTEPIAFDELPRYLQMQGISRTEPRRFVVQVYPQEDVWEPEEMRPFIEQTRAIDPQITGPPVQIYESGLLMRRAYLMAGIIAVAAVFALTLVDFLKPLDALLCLVPVTIGFICTFGLMWLGGVTLNPANIIVLPLLFGIGVSFGVQIMHRYKQARYTRPLGLSQGTMKALTLSSLTTIIAFASMLLAQHKGIQSLGFVLASGIALTLIASLTVMPCILELRNRYHVMRRYRQWKQIGEAIAREHAAGDGDRLGR
jgi:hopanoid biosynthesis associated RND transporter like protein HpnN